MNANTYRSAWKEQGTTDVQEETLLGMMAKLSDSGAGMDMNPVLESCAMDTTTPIVAALGKAGIKCFHLCTVEEPSIQTLLHKYPTFNDIQDGIVVLEASAQEADQTERTCVTSTSPPPE